MQQHVRILGWIFIAYGALFLIVAAIAAFFLIGGGLISGDRDAMVITSGIALLLTCIFGVLSIPMLVTGSGLLKFRPWARIAAIVLGVLQIMSFPIGTALAVYTLWVLLNAQTEPLFRGGTLVTSA